MLQERLAEPPINVPAARDESAGMAHVFKRGELDLSHKVILYLEGISVSFDGFKALNNLSLTIDPG